MGSSIFIVPTARFLFGEFRIDSIYVIVNCHINANDEIDDDIIDNFCHHLTSIRDSSRFSGLPASPARPAARSLLEGFNIDNTVCEIPFWGV